MRVYWNNSSINHYFRPSSLSAGTAELTWRARSGQTFQIVRGPSRKAELDLLVDGVSFAQLPTLGKLGRMISENASATHAAEKAVEDRSPGNDEELERLRLDCAPDFSDVSDLDSTDLFDDAFASSSTKNPSGLRLSLEGLNGSTSIDQALQDAIHDELHSDLYSPVLESLRLQITTSLPQTEEMVSRAIMNAFFRDSSSLQSLDSLSLDSADAVDPYQVEVDCLWEATEWVRLNVEYAPRPDTEDMALEFFQKRTDEILCRVRQEELTSDEAARILLSVAAALGLKFASPLPQTTIILNGLEKGVTKDDIYSVLATFGDVEATAIAKATHRFGFARFSHEESATRVFETVDNAAFPLVGKSLSISALRENLDDGLNPCSRSRPQQPNVCQITFDETLDVLETAPPPAPVDTTPHLMGPLCSEEGLLLLGSPVCVSQTPMYPSPLQNHTQAI